MSITNIYRKALSVISKKPLTLWGLSLMYNLLSVLTKIFAVIPIIQLPIQAGLDLGVSAIYLDGLHERQVTTDQLFYAFNSKFLRNAGSMLWRLLWLIIWALAGVGIVLVSCIFMVIPVIGGVFVACAGIAAVCLVIYKIYSYSFVPYIVLTNKNIRATGALRASKTLTQGICLKMFLADFIAYLAMGLGFIIFALPSIITRYFIFIEVIYVIAVIMFSSLFFGLVHAAFFEAACPNAKVWLDGSDMIGRENINNDKREEVRPEERREVRPQQPVDNFDKVRRAVQGVPGRIANDMNLSSTGKIRGLTGEYAGLAMDIKDHEMIIIGRNPEVCHLCIHDKLISGKHCSIRFNAYGNSYMVTDYSTNGTYYEDGRKFPINTEVEVPSGEKILLGSQDNMFLLG